MADFDPDADAFLFDEALRAWALISPTLPTSGDAARWSSTFDEYLARRTDLAAAGEWVHGPADLMRVLEVENQELVHSRAVGWLLDPAARHGLGDRILARILAAGWPDDPTAPSSQSAVITLEVTLHKTRSDVVVRMGPTVLVVENKVLADEHSGQCETLYREWLDFEPNSELRFLLLTVDGHRPHTTSSPEAAAAWRSLSYAALRTLLEDVLATATTTTPQGIRGRESAHQYAATLQAFGSRSAGFKVGIGGGHVG